VNRALLVDVVRSPFGKGREGGALAALHPVDLYAQVLGALVERTGIDPGEVEDVITGCVIQVGEQAANIARHAWLAAGLPETVPGVTLDRKCGSAQQAFDFAAQGIAAGAYDVVIAGGVESMSRVPMKSNRAGRDPLGPAFHRRFDAGLVSQGISAELIAARWDLSREALDAYALRSHRRAAAAEDQGLLARQIVAVEVPGDAHDTEPADGAAERAPRVVDRDEGIRRDTSAGRLAALPAAFRSDLAQQRFPHLDWRVTAGNASQVSDGAVAMLLCSERAAARLRLSPRAALTHWAVVGDDPVMMLTGVIPATRKVLARAGRRIDQVDVFEVSEAFASVVLAWQRELGVDPERVNVHGGAIAFGHPVGASGGRLLASLLDALDTFGGRIGLQTMCESGGMANATLVERL
jgi:acetyl-CoA acetyltransferase family protein